ncbi:hypothetical protein G2W53_030381 [Senna tora]|uniref:Uncharacterized protein n=1 Tax=Senna tora TaxID=362788 RepID=A0A834WBJ7_9FABA|nr:hypothetical protein G2W53_030381 [Senna tora]
MSAHSSFCSSETTKACPYPCTSFSAIAYFFFTSKGRSKHAASALFILCINSSSTPNYVLIIPHRLLNTRHCFPVNIGRHLLAVLHAARNINLTMYIYMSHFFHIRNRRAKCDNITIGFASLERGRIIISIAISLRTDELKEMSKYAKQALLHPTTLPLQVMANAGGQQTLRSVAGGTPPIPLHFKRPAQSPVWHLPFPVFWSKQQPCLPQILPDHPSGTSRTVSSPVARRKPPSWGVGWPALPRSAGHTSSLQLFTIIS